MPGSRPPPQICACTASMERPDRPTNGKKKTGMTKGSVQRPCWTVPLGQAWAWIERFKSRRTDQPLTLGILESHLEALQFSLHPKVSFLSPHFDYLESRGAVVH